MKRTRQRRLVATALIAIGLGIVGGPKSAYTQEAGDCPTAFGAPKSHSRPAFFEASKVDGETSSGTFSLRFNKCVDLLKPWFEVHIGTDVVSTYDTLGREIESLKREMESMDVPGVVVYLPFPVFRRRQEGGASREFSGMVTLRFETQGTGKPILQDALLPKGNVREKDFETLLTSAQKPSAEAAREELRSFLPVNHENDAGKFVFFKDINLYGLIPQSFGMTDAVAIVSPSLTEALARRQALATLKPKARDFTAVIGYPDAHGDYDVVFNGQSAAPLATWQKRTADMRSIAVKHDVDLVSANELRQMDGKQEFLSRIENAKGIVLVIAHADGATVRLPGMGGGLTITPADIAQLHLKNSPFVVLRICNAVDRGYADAFGRAGATGVWANRGIITAETANRQIAAFFEELAAGQSILESIQKIQARDGAAKASVGLFTALKPLAPSQEAPSGESRHGHRETS